MKKSSFLSLKATALLSVVPAVAGLCLLTSCNREELPAEGKYNVTVALSTDGTKALNLDENESVSSIVIYAFADVDDAVGSGTLVGYYYSNAVGDGQDTFPMRLTGNGESGMVDFFVILNPDSEDFKIYNSATNAEVNFGSSAPATLQPSEILSWKLKRSSSNGNFSVSTPVRIPMSSLPETKENPTTNNNRRFQITASDGRWQTIPVEVTRAVSKVEVRFWSKDNLPAGSHPTSSDNYSSIDGMVLTDPIYCTEVFNPHGSNSADYFDDPTDRYTWFATDNTEHNGLNDPFPEHAVLDDFRLIGEQYILPNTFFGGNSEGEVPKDEGANAQNTTTLDISYTYHYGGWYSWTDDGKKVKSIALPACQRNTKIIVWCQLNDDTDRTFTYQVVDWDEEMTIDIPDFD